MGVLDDAIREHLELRRRHGVAEEELRRQEEEALGPIRRDVASAEAHGDDEVSDEAAAVEAEDAVPPPEAVVHDALAADDEAEPPDARAPDVHAEEDSDALAVDQPESVVDVPPLSVETEEHEFEELDDDELLDEDGEPLEDERVGPLGEPADEPDEPSDEAEEGEDVLEDTPDFLQETPEHDRLWFEQKPPRDFDFD